MDITIRPQKLCGTVNVIPSKSQAHRYLICAALAKSDTALICPQTNADIEATVACLNAIGANILRTAEGYHVQPIREPVKQAVLPCSESGSTLRFLLPIVGALGIDATFKMQGRLPSRPLSPLWEEMERMGCKLERPTEDTLRCQGKLQPGAYFVRGDVSSQFITGLLFAHKILGDCTLEITGKTESAPYIRMTEQALAMFEAPPGVIHVEGDWSNGAFWLAANALGNDLKVLGLEENSPQGDKIVAKVLKNACNFFEIDAKNVPDLVPILSIVASLNKGAVFTNIARLRLKESDRVEAILAMIKTLGGKAEATEDTITVYGTGLKGGTVNSFGDHRIAMSAAIAATRCIDQVTILGAEAVNKSYPQFWEEYKKLGGSV